VAPMPSRVDTAAFRRTVGRFATGVTVVTTVVDGVAHGMTANAFSSLSLDPLLVLVCVDRSAGLHERVTRAGTFAICVLAEGQEALSRRFAARHPAGAGGQFEGVATVPAPVTGSPLLEGGLVYLECRLSAVHPGGDHSIFVGEVLAAGELGGTEPLLWFEGGYHRLARD